MSGHIERATVPPSTAERAAPFTLADPGDGWTIDGYGAVFNTPTTIDSVEGRFREQIAWNSMARSFRESPPIMQFDHGRHPLIGSWPIAKLERAAEEVDPVLAPNGGAHVIGRMIPHLFFEPIREAISVGAVNGMSFRMEVLREQWHTHDGEPVTDQRHLTGLLRASWEKELPDEELPVRTLKDLKVPELGPVVWPAYRQTSVGVRSTIIDLGRLRDDPQARTLFAQAMWDMAEQENTDDAQRATATAVGEHPSDLDAQQPAADAAGEHPSDTQQPAAPLRAAGERLSKPPLTQRKPLKRGRRPVDIMVRTAREVSLRIAQENKHVS